MRRLTLRRNDTCFDCNTQTHCPWHGDLDEIAWDEFERRIGCVGAYREVEAFAEGVEWGAGWMAAIIAMAEAIRARQPCSLCVGEDGWVDEERRLCMRCDPDWKPPT
jgi:hypothetical protein